MKYYLFIFEDGHVIKTGNKLGYTTKEEAIVEARKRVDDALPHNTIHVLQDIGYAFFTGDGGDDFRETP